MDGRPLNLLVDPDVRVGLFDTRSALPARETFAARPGPTRTSGSTPAGPARRPSRLSRYVLPAIALFAALTFAVAAVATPTDENQVIVPNSSSVKNPSPGGVPGSGAFTLVAVLVLAGAGGWLVWRGRNGKFATLNRTARQLAIEETRSLGNRQYLVVASYRDKKFLLGVCPGRIDLLSPLHDGAAAAPLSSKERA